MKTSKYISKIGVGTVQFGLDYGISNTKGKVSPNEVSQILKLAEDNRIAYLDTARAYGNSEQVLGMNLKNSFNIVSKISPAAKNAHQEIKISLENLQIEKLYAYLFHDFDTFKNQPSLWEELKEAKSEGKVKKIGFSLYYPSELELLFEQNIEFDILQIPYNLFDRRFEPYFQKLKSKNIEIHVRSVFLQGLFFMDNQNLSTHFDSASKKLTDLHVLAKNHQLNKTALPLFFVLNNPNIDVALLGLSSLSDLEKNLKIINDFDKIEQLKLDFTTFEEQNEKIILPFLWEN
ncbi:putative oxidoreductase, aryl-alcohol dehydrogenase like protein [Bernardetia litoralis DSM 6794]|uniref:Putative oxidoreductase, aryl-alcohol dehydrogenase like protein n=1 Tax=Bernardetia litoralis (strain ATCC 23117 / DSM 6794 / NBRC 15988 / NCIMB 1366 / Fx l1 / Sio-4) TaxID=880071 RepID=I4APH3_BERLS|nr:aldo/keto reductase [Bernardetia litoralis]AFM05858.1 putative oxidoreductase, aryl-alcohol dehydrogenase like protein [Bernardetia litoralis DSM 6794]